MRKETVRNWMLRAYKQDKAALKQRLSANKFKQVEERAKSLSPVKVNEHSGSRSNSVE